MKIKDLIQETNRYLSGMPEPRPYVAGMQLSKSDVRVGDMVYYFLDPRARGGDPDELSKFVPSKFKSKPSSSGLNKQYPDPLEPLIKDGRVVGVILPNGKTRLMSKSDAVGPDGKIYNWMDPRGRKSKDSNTNEDASRHPALQGWDEMSSYDKERALRDAGLVGPAYMGDGARSDEILHQAKLRSRERDYELEIGPRALAELKTKAQELAEMQRQQLRQERIEDQKIAYDRYKDEAERKDAMAKIDKEYKNNLEVINTEHRNNMEAIRTGNTQEIDKINLDHEEAARERQHEFDRDDRQNRRDRDTGSSDMPEPQDDKEAQPDDDEIEPFRPQAPAGPALSAPSPGKKPSKYDNSDAIDVDAREVPNDKDKPRKPPQLPKPSNESWQLARILKLAGLQENIFTTDYHKVMDAVAKLYGDHYDINIWENGDAHDAAAKVLMKEHPTAKELDYIVNTGELPERFMELDFPLNDDIMYGAGVGGGDDVQEAVVDEEPASRSLCQSGKPDSALGASQLSSCKSQGYRSRDGGKSHKVGSERVRVRGKKIKGKKYGGPLPDWS